MENDMSSENVKELKQIAKERQVKYYYNMRKDELINASSQKQRPVPRLIQRPVPRPIQRPVPRPIQRPVSAPRSVQRPVPHPIQRPVPRPIQRPVPRPIQRPVSAPRPVQRPVPHPIQRPVPRPIHRPVLCPIQRPVPRHIQRPVPRPIQSPVPHPIQSPVPHPIQRLVLRPIQRPVPRHIQRPVPRPIQRPVPRPIQRPVLRPIQRPVPRPIQRPVPAPRLVYKKQIELILSQSAVKNVTKQLTVKGTKRYDAISFMNAAKKSAIKILDQYNPIKAKSYIPLDKNLATKKAIINIKNEDNQCFKWCIARALNPTDNHPERESLSNHKSYCETHDSVRIELPPPNSTMQFTNHNKSMRVPFVVYADFESFIKQIDTCEPNPNESYTKQYQKHIPSSFCYCIKCFDESFYQSIPVAFTASSETDDVAQIFVDSLQEDVKKM
ncbi:selenoprotein V-like [Hydra vulgaris]|uniref:Selenoprotein V-like n=1 Tax=Hydra vulgaris TaxID=6087 RepID=A0ABM4CMA5_HYDVU